MASIVGKRRGNQTYYYLVESARVRVSRGSWNFGDDPI
jgi:hypothetical protein